MLNLFYNEIMAKINVIGAACIDLLISGYDKHLLFSNKYKVDDINTYLGGDGLNQAIVLNYLNNDVKLMFCSKFFLVVDELL